MPCKNPMLVYPANAPDKLGFTEIKAQLESHCLSPMGQALVKNLVPGVSLSQIEQSLTETASLKQLLQSGVPFPVAHYIDLQTPLLRIKPAGTFLPAETVFSLEGALQTVFSIIDCFVANQLSYPALAALVLGLEKKTELLQDISKIIDLNGQVRETASPELLRISGEIATLSKESRNRLEGAFLQAGKEGWLAQDSLVIRSGRRVIPLLAAHKNRLNGFVHDRSDTGKALYIEPESVLQMNEKIRELELQKEAAIVKVLISLTDKIRDHLSLLLQYHALLEKVDFMRAKALLAASMQASKPILHKQPIIDLHNAQHPLLAFRLKGQSKSPVPLYLKIDETDRLILISGPNAGGKSVCLKTVGLLQLMLQSGLLIPADKSSKMGLFNTLLVDIGDDQSLSSDLSTYSAHLSKMRDFIEKANPQSLILIDELGTGTDPSFGAAIAEAVLQVLGQKQVKGVLTTHYADLKTFASLTTGFVNASMRFDQRKMKPQYILEMGKPGSSYAFEIAEKINLPKEVLNLAKNNINQKQKEVETLLVNLERDKQILWQEQQDFQKRKKRLDGLLQENQALKSYYTENHRKLLSDAKLEALNIVKSAGKLVENSIAEIKNTSANKAQVKQVRQALKAETEKLLPDQALPSPKANQSPICLHDWVTIADTGAQGQIMKLDAKDATVAIGSLMAVVKLSRLYKIASKKPQAQASRTSYPGFDLIAKTNFSPEIDLRGSRAAEAMQSLMRLMDQALVLKIDHLRIIHGKGDGILRKLIRKELSRYPTVERLDDEHIDRGGDGITLVTLG